MAKEPTTEELEKALVALETAASECSIEQISGMPSSFRAGLKLAEGMLTMRSLLTEPIVEKLLMPLCGSPLGFLTDRDNATDKEGRPLPKYTWEVVRDCAIEAFVRGFSPIGNEWNIISKRFYAAKNGVDRKVREFPGLTDLQYRPGVPHLPNDKGALVPYRVYYKRDGQKCELIRDLIREGDKVISDQRIPVRVNYGMGADAIIGKAHRKIVAQLLLELTGSKLSLPMADIDDEPLVTTAEAAPADAPAEKAQSSQDSQLQEVLNKHKPKDNGAPTAAEMAEDERKHAGK